MVVLKDRPSCAKFLKSAKCGAGFLVIRMELVMRKRIATVQLNLLTAIFVQRNMMLKNNIQSALVGANSEDNKQVSI